MSERFNVADLVRDQAQRAPERTALITPRSKRGWQRTSYAEFERRIDSLAHALHRSGLRPSDRVLVFVRPGVDWAALLFALFRLGAVPALIDPAMGRAGVLACVERISPRGFVGLAAASALKLLFRSAFRSVEVSLTVDRFAVGAQSLRSFERGDDGAFDPAATTRDDAAAILFTSGSTGPAKGVVYTHGMCGAQVAALRDLYGMREGDVDVACFAPFALFGPALGLTTVLPRIDFSHPARAKPSDVVEAVREHGAVQCFGSPAIWRNTAPWCREQGIKLDSIQRLMVAGAPVHPSMIAECLAMLSPRGEVHTPYGATESLPVSSAAGRQILARAALTSSGAGNFVGRPGPSCEARVIRITDAPIAAWSDDWLAARGELGELVVRGPQVTREYAFEPAHTAAAKIRDGASVWHRMGDLVRIDDEGCIWFHGRKSHRLETVHGVFGPVAVENVFRAHAGIARCALVGVGERGREAPVLVVEPHAASWPQSDSARASLSRAIRAAGAAHPLGAHVEHVLLRRELPVDVRHNAKIDRGALKLWATEQLA